MSYKDIKKLRGYSKKNSKKIVKRKRIWRIENRKKYLQQVDRHNKTINHKNNCKKYRNKNRENITIKIRLYRRKNPEKSRAIVQRYAKQNKDKIKSRNYANRHFKLGKKCQICKSIKRLHKHHIDYIKQIIITTCCRCNINIKTRGLEGKSLKAIKQDFVKNNWYNL